MSKVLRQAASVARNLSRLRTFSSSTVSRKDLVQDLYLKELKAYKAPPTVKDAHVGIVKSYTLPPAPKVPALPSDLASELSAYDSTEPSKASQSTPTSASSAETVTGADQYLAFLEQDLPKAEVHH